MWVNVVFRLVYSKYKLVRPTHIITLGHFIRIVIILQRRYSITKEIKNLLGQEKIFLQNKIVNLGNTLLISIQPLIWFALMNSLSKRKEILE